jgi:hypothetical protein
VTNLEGPADTPLTLTHARLRAAQGDVDAARRILRAVLGADPANREASGLLRALDGGGETGSRSAVLREWLDTITQGRGPRRHAR